MKQKIQPPGICDHCLGPIRIDWYTTKGRPRLYCSIDCKNTANSRNGAHARSVKQKQHVEDGTWRNPAKINPPTNEEQARRARLARLREVAKGTWRNPGLAPEAREINSLPHKHSGALADAISKLGHGAHVHELTPEEQEAHRAYRREISKKRSPRP